MKITAFIPYWLEYHESHEMKKLSGKYLINYTVEQLINCDLVEEIIVYASNEKIMDYVDEKDFVTYLKRPGFLDDNSIAIEQVIEEFLKVNDSDIIVLIHPNSPFLSKKTITECIEKVIDNTHESSFVAYKFNNLAWFENKPLNYSLEFNTPHMDEISPIILELSSLYVFKRKVFERSHRRIGENPFICIVNHFEGHGINNQEDFEIAELIVNAGMYPKVVL